MAKGRRIVCAGCAQPTSLGKPICDDCLALAGEVGKPICMLCEAGLAVDKFGQHTTKTGGYAGKCVAHQLSSEPK